MNKKIYINGRFLSQSISGVQKFSWGVSHALSNLGYEVIFLCPKNIIQPPKFGRVQFCGYLKGHAWEQIDLPLFLKKNRIQVFLNLCNTAPLTIKNQYISIHDLAFYRHPEWFNPQFANWYNWLIPKISKRAKHIFTVSEFSKDELMTAYGLSPTKITVVPNGIYWPDRDEEKIKNSKFEKYALLVGSDNPRKNYDLVFKAFNQIKNKNFNLVIVGNSSLAFNDSEKKKSKGVYWLENLSSNQLKHLYKEAHLCINPSLYEGFGLPILESLSANCPVLASDIKPFKEIYGDNIHYFRNDDELNLKSELASLMNHKREVVDISELLETLNYKSAAQKIADTILNS